MVELPENYKDIKDSMDDIGKSVEGVRTRQGVAAWVQLGTATLTTVAALISGFNNMELNRVKANQAEIQAAQDTLRSQIAQRQIEEGVSTSVLHETMTLLDTKEKDVLRQKVKMQLLLLQALKQQSEDAGKGDDSMRVFYTNLLQALPSALGDTTEAQELSDFVNNDSTQTGTAAPKPVAVSAKPSSSLPSRPVASPPAQKVTISRNGEAVVQGDANGWNIDFYWCVGDTPFPGTNDNEALAGQLFQAVVDQQAANKLGRIRLRRLPELVNQTPGYNITPGAITIRATPEKAKMAETLQGWLTDALTAMHQTISVRVEEGRNRVPLYLPLYVCSMTDVAAATP